MIFYCELGDFDESSSSFTFIQHFNEQQSGLGVITNSNCNHL